MGVQTPTPGRKDGLNALRLQLGAEGVAVVGPIRPSGADTGGILFDPHIFPRRFRKWSIYEGQYIEYRVPIESLPIESSVPILLPMHS